MSQRSRIFFKNNVQRVRLTCIFILTFSITYKKSINFDNFLLNNSISIYSHIETNGYSQLMIGYENHGDHYDDRYMFDRELNLINSNPFFIEESSAWFLNFNNDARSKFFYGIDLQKRKSINKITNHTSNSKDITKDQPINAG